MVSENIQKAYARFEHDRRLRIAKSSNWKSAPQVAAALELADTDDGIPSAASPLSIYERKPHFQRRVEALSYPESKSMLATILPYSGYIPAKEISREHVFSTQQKLQRDLRRLSVHGRHESLFCTDVTIFEQIESGSEKPVYYAQIHFHGIMHKDDRYLLNGLRETRGMQHGAKGMKAIHTTAVTDRAGAAEYCMKWCISQRTFGFNPATERRTMYRPVYPAKRALLMVLYAWTDITPSQLEFRMNARDPE